ncbi:MAG: amidohydrolase family protein [Rhizobiales bacterium]|nr:amidohydrolase family protein [Hyphomicrobiales bacterium]
MFDFVIRGNVVTPERVIEDGYLAVSGSTIRAVGTGEPPPSRRVEDFTGHLLFPGLIDAQTHAGSHEGIAGLADATRAAAAGGVTTIVDMPFDDPIPVTDLATWQAKVDKIAELAVVDVGLYVTAKKEGDVAGHLESLIEAGACAVKLSTYEYHPVRFPRFTTGEMYRIFLAAASLGVPVAFHNEDQEIVSHFLAESRARGDTSPAAHGRSRPPMAELVANAQILELASHTGVRCHIVHSSIPEGFKLVAEYRRRGHDFTAETCLQYLIFNEDDMVARGAFLKQNPPLRAEEFRRRMWQSLADGEIDLVSTDHVAWPVSRKSDPDIFKNGSGIPGLETLLPVFYTEAVTVHGLSPTVIAQVSALNPAKHFGFYPRKGFLGVGADADIAVMKLGATIFDQAKMTSTVKWSPFHGRPLAATIAATFVRGTKVFEHGKVLVPAGFGQLLKPSGKGSRKAS